MRYLSVCSGIEAASVAWHPLGWTPVAFSEIEKFPSAVLAHHYPTVPNLGDMTEMDVEPLGDVDILVGGTPCQAFSVAGLRQSLNDARGNLTLSYVRLIHELVGHHKLRNAVWENVPGVLSTKDNAFGCFLGAIVGSDNPLVPHGGKRWPNSGLVSGPKGRAAWTIKDAQYFGLAQRRRRVFVVSDFGNGADPAAVLFELEGVQGNPAPSREARKDVAPTISARTKGGGGLGTDFDLDGGVIDTAVLRGISDYDPGKPALRAKGGDAGGGSEALVTQGYGGGRTSGPVEVAAALAAHGVRMDFEVETFITQAVSVTGEISHTLKAEGFDASEDGTGRGNPIIAFQNHGSNVEVGEHTTGTLLQNSDRTSGSTPCIAQTVALRGREGGATAELGGDVATALRASQGGGDKPHVLAFQSKASHHQSMNPDTISPSLQVGKSDGVAAFYGSAVRRLTPVECERLQGFPDNYTKISGKTADGPRYKALGNSMAVPVMRWIGERIERFMPREEAPVRKQLRFRADGRMEFV